MNNCKNIFQVHINLSAVNFVIKYFLKLSLTKYTNQESMMENTENSHVLPKTRSGSNYFLLKVQFEVGKYREISTFERKYSDVEKPNL